MVFEWDAEKEASNLEKHGIGFSTVPIAFEDPMKLIISDARHSTDEERFYCIGNDGTGILTIRFTFRNSRIRVIGAGYWRKQKQTYEKANGQI